MTLRPYPLPIPGGTGKADCSQGGNVNTRLFKLAGVAVAVLAYIAFNETRFGRYVTGIGANAEAVRRGVRIDEVGLTAKRAMIG